MKEKSYEKFEATVKKYRFVMRISAIVGWAILFLTVMVITKGVELSQKDAMMAEVLSKAFAGESDLYPMTGIDYELEARIVTDDGRSGWRHDAITADYGDTIEVRLKAIAANPTDVNYATVKESALFTSSAGLIPLTTAADHDLVVLPDGSLADYVDEFFDDHITYVAIGTFELSPRDWFAGKSASTITALPDGMNAKLVVLFPYCEVDIVLVLVLAAVFVLFGLVLPLIFKLEMDKALKRLKDAE